MQTQFHGQIVKLANHREGGWTISCHIPEISASGEDQTQKAKELLEMVRKNSQFAIVLLPEAV